jgi:hypothetical protein
MSHAINFIYCHETNDTNDTEWNWYEVDQEPVVVVGSLLKQDCTVEETKTYVDH